MKSAEGGKSNLAGSQLPKTTPEKSDAAEPVPMTKEKSKAAEQFENDLDRYR